VLISLKLIRRNAFSSVASRFLSVTESTGKIRTTRNGILINGDLRPRGTCAAETYLRTSCNLRRRVIIYFTLRIHTKTSIDRIKNQKIDILIHGISLQRQNARFFSYAIFFIYIACVLYQNNIMNTLGIITSC